MAFDPLTATPRRTFCVDNRQLTSQGDEAGPWISSLGVTDKMIVLADRNNNKVKVMDIRNPDIVRSLPLEVKPWGMAVLHDEVVAVTSDYDYVILFIDVTTLQVVKQVKTARRYRGICCGKKEDILIVSSDEKERHPARIDILSRDGKMLRTVADGSTLPGLRWPNYLCVIDDDVIISDCHNASHCVCRLDLATGKVKATHSRQTHSQLKYPHQVSADRSGNMYIANFGGYSVLVVGVDGRWRTLLSGEEHGEGKYDTPMCVAVTDTGVVVVWIGRSGSIVTGFDLI